MHEVSREALLAALESHPPAALALIEILAGRFRETASVRARRLGLGERLEPEAARLFERRDALLERRVRLEQAGEEAARRRASSGSGSR